MPTPVKSQTHRRHPAATAALVTALTLAAIVFSSGRVSSQGSDPQRRDLEKVFSRHDRLSLDPGQIHRQVKQTRSLTLNTSRGTFEMTLEPHDMRAPGYVAEAWGDNGVHVIETGPVRTYKGTVEGLPGAQARMTIDEGTVEGLIVTPSELFFLEPSKRFSGSAAKTDFVFYAASDVKESAGDCGNTMAEMVEQHSTNASSQTSSKGPQPEAVFGPQQQIAIALEADFEYYQAFGSSVAAVQNQILTIMNQVDGIYSNDLGLRFNFTVTNLRVWTSDTDPYTTAVPSDLLAQFRTSYNATPPAEGAGRDIAHLWTGRDLTGSTIGIAYRPGLECPFDPTGFAYGISQHLTSPTANLAGLTAHEIGHNMNANHVTSAQGSDCGDPGGSIRSIMNASIASSSFNNFCQFSKDEITNHAIAESACLTSLTQPGCTYALSQSTQNLPAGAGGNSVNITTQPGCNWAVAEGESWLTVTSGASGTGSGTVTYTVTANSVCGARTGEASIGGRLLTVNQAGNANYLTDPATATAITPFQTVNGDLSSADCPTGLAGRTTAFMDRYKFTGMAGQKIRIEMNATVAPPNGLDTYLYLYGPDGNLVPGGENDDIVLGSETNSRIPCTSPCNTGPPGLLTLPQTGTYIIIATSFSNGDSGGYSLTLTSEPLLLTAQVTDNVGSAAALNSVTFARTSNASNTAFRIFDPYNFSADQTTRLILFTSNLGLIQQQNPDPSVLTVRAGGVELVVEHVGPLTFPGLNGSYVVVALKAKQSGQTMPTGSLAFTVTTATLTSNVVTITIAP
ncbi:MAG: M12 family metallo-peptidase [Acidobacteriota bacterium]